MRFQQIANHLLSEGDSACPPEPPLRFAMMLYYLLWNYRSTGGCHSGEGGGLGAVDPESVEKNIVTISHEIKLHRYE